jgi:hypothetical protein
MYTLFHINDCLLVWVHQLLAQFFVIIMYDMLLSVGHHITTYWFVNLIDRYYHYVLALLTVVSDVTPYDTPCFILPIITHPVNSRTPR